MVTLEHIQTEISSLSKHDYIKLRHWMEAMDWENWDRQIVDDSAAGKLDFLKQEALQAKFSGTLQKL